MPDSRSDKKLVSAQVPKRLPGWSKCLGQARSAMQSFLYEEAISHCEQALASSALRPESEAMVRCLLAEALESLAQFSKALSVLTAYENDQHRRMVSLSVQSEICFRLGSAYGATDLPRAIAYAKQSIALAQEENALWAIAKNQILLGTLYRRLGELWFAREHFLKVIDGKLGQGHQLLLAKAYNGIGIVYFLEGEFDRAKHSFFQALEALSTMNDPLMQGSTDLNLGVIASLQGQMQESVLLIERALPLLERARDPRLIVNAYSNLGHSLLRLGELQRAEEILQESLTRAKDCEATLVVATTLETLGDLYYLKGDFEKAEKLLTESLNSLKKLKVGFNYAAALLVQGRGRLLAGEVENAAESFRESLQICERMGDPRGRAAAQLCIIEAYLAQGETVPAQKLLQEIKEEIERIDTNTLMGYLREVSGSVQLALHQTAEAVQCFNQAISIREVMGDRYRLGITNYYLAEAQFQCGEITVARQTLEIARSIFEKLEARPMLDRVKTLAQRFKTVFTTNSKHADISGQIISVITRLLDAEFSQEVLLREMVRILSEELQVSPVIFFKENNTVLQPFVWSGCTEAVASQVGHDLMKNEVDLRAAILYSFSEQSEIKFLYLGKPRVTLPDSLLELLIKQFRIGLERSSQKHKLPFLATPSFASELNQISLPGLVYRSEVMKKIVEQVLSLRSSEITVLITGETGTGKDLVARAIHAYSKRAAHTFIPFNCASAPRELIESQLFGHRRGAFTGATADFPGMIGAAEKGTLFLDEVGELASEMQPKLLRFFQNGEVQRLGEVSPRIANVRILAATNRDLEEMVTNHQFRADLYYRLNVIELRMPALRERREEISLLAEHFLARNLAQSDKQDISLSSNALSLLKQYDWPGNARQLENEMQRLVALAPAGTTITESLLSPNIRNQSKIRLISSVSSLKHSLAEAVADTEHQMIREALTRHQGNISRVAIELGVSRYGLRKMLRRHHLLPQSKIA